MNAAAKFWRLSIADKALLLNSLLRLAAVRIGLGVLGYRKLAPLLATRLSAQASAAAPDKLAWAVGAAARALPGSSCLAQALTLHCLLSRAGHDSLVRIGVAKGEAQPINAHAWVIHHNQVLIGQTALGERDFATLTDIKLHAS